MIPVLTPQQMKSADDYAIHRLGIPSLQLMENAGRGVVEVLKQSLKQLSKRSFVIFCGKGNNGGDGFVIARVLNEHGATVTVVMMEQEEKLSGDAKINFERVHRSFMVPFEQFTTTTAIKADVIIDAMFGTSFKGELSGNYLAAVQWCNRHKGLNVAVDVPSGLNGETGEVLSDAFRADMTITFSNPKLGFYRRNAKDVTGTVIVVDIGIPDEAIERNSGNIFLVERHDVETLLPQRKSNVHKHSVGKVFIIAGSRGMTGAALLSSLSAMRSGAGQVILGIPDSEYSIVAKRTLEVMPLGVPATSKGSVSVTAKSVLEKKIDWADVVAIGCGMSQHPETQELMLQLIAETEKPLVVDADGLNALAKNISVLHKRKSKHVILTPHVGEFSRLTGLSAAEIEEKKFTIASSFAQQYSTVLVLKGAPTLVATPNGELFVNSTGNAGMATAGTGDVLTGIIASLAGQGLSAVAAAVAGVYIHGMAGDYAAKKKGEMSLIASDLIRYLPVTLKQLQ